MICTLLSFLAFIADRKSQIAWCQERHNNFAKAITWLLILLLEYKNSHVPKKKVGIRNYMRS